MPDHVHFVIWLSDSLGERMLSQGAQPRAPTLGNIVGAFKTVVARSINEHRDTPGRPVWQRNYDEHIVRDERELDRIRAYIRYNSQSAHDHTSEDLSDAWEANP